MNVVTAPEPLRGPRPWIFLAGSIEQGVADRWQDRVIAHFADSVGTLLNPRRAAWDANWRQSIDEPRFREQVEWELDALDDADTILMHFDPATKAPITLLELGLYASSGKLRVSCPEGYWRLGNVQIVCARYEVALVDSLEALLAVGHPSSEDRSD